jgi:hypothetical protein
MFQTELDKSHRTKEGLTLTVRRKRIKQEIKSMNNKKNILNFTLSCLLVGFVGCKSNTLYNINELSPTDKGIHRAQEDIKNGKIQILYYGKPWSVGKPLIDDETGLPVIIVEGCVVTTDFVEETDAYNKIMRAEAIRNKK